MNQQHFFENHVSKKHKQSLIDAIGLPTLIQQEQIHLSTIDAGKQERIRLAKLACQQRRDKRHNIHQVNHHHTTKTSHHKTSEKKVQESASTS